MENSILFFILFLKPSLSLTSLNNQYRFRILGLIGQNFPIRVSISNNTKFSAIAIDSLDIEPIRNLDYLWVSAGERYDILIDVPRFECQHRKRPPLQMQFIGYTNLQKGNSGLCSIALITFPGSYPVDESYTLPSDCSDLQDYDNVFPLNRRILNPPPQVNESDLTSSPFYNKVLDPYTESDAPGSIFPVVARSLKG